MEIAAWKSRGGEGKSESPALMYRCMNNSEPMAIASEYYSPGCEESTHLSLFDENPSRFVPFELRFILPGRFFLAVQGSQLLTNRFDFLICDSDLVIITQQSGLGEAGPFYFDHNTVNNEYLILKYRFGHSFLHPKYRRLSTTVLRSTVVGVFHFKSKVCKQGFQRRIVCHPVICNVCPRLVSTSIRHVYEKIGKRHQREYLTSSVPAKRHEIQVGCPDVDSADAVQGSTDVEPSVRAASETSDPNIQCPAGGSVEHGAGSIERPGSSGEAQTRPTSKNSQQSEGNSAGAPNSSRDQRCPLSTETSTRSSPRQRQETVENSLQPMTVAPSKRTVPTKRKRTTTPKRMELSITICITGSDLSPQLFPLVDDFLQRECEAGLFAVERGGSLLNLHLQGVIAIICTSALDVKKRITAAIHWDENRPLVAGVCVKKLTNKGIHTFVGMVGYCLKDRKDFHFRVTMKNINDAVQREGMMLFTFFGAADLKNRVELNPSTIMQRALQYNKYVSHHPLGTSFRGCIRRMLVRGHYTPSTTWLINKEMDKSCMAALWKCYVQPGTITLADVDQIFFWMPRLQPSRYIEGVDHGLQFLKTSVLNDMVDSDHIQADTEQISGNPAAHDLPDWAFFISCDLYDM
ncbi:hypothetical protein R1sor_014994 [Riccia sorocarpa]|uniref:Replitron HUH endonuclease domain-containing protein n=1 Tax=Riccia sorocarpa TaxID=122646 RepID=A0ABD3HEU4_9MARC